ncbi:uncharacterized protein [Magallana gigas]|uniref:uncharacterized protein n=1 Tax=Magallana gigas TaxID=29159 RepID=UPI00333F77AA
MIMHLFVMFMTISHCSYSAFSMIAPGTINGCKFGNGTRYCCSGFYEVNNECHECEGSYGLNCTDPCPEGWYGPVCMYQCMCSANDTCDPKKGCINAYLAQPFALPIKPELTKDTKSSILLNKSSGSSRGLSFHFSTSNSIDTSSSIIQGPYLPENATDTSLWKNIKEMVETAGIRDWIITSLAGVLLIIFVVIGVKKCWKKKVMEKYGDQHEDQHGYCKSTQRYSGDYSCINENEYTEISTVRAASTD